MKPIRMKKPQRLRYFGQLHNLSKPTPWGSTCWWCTPLGLSSRKIVDDLMPWCPDNAKAGHIVLRRMTVGAPGGLTRPYRNANLEEGSHGVVVNGILYNIGLSLPVSDEYYCV